MPGPFLYPSIPSPYFTYYHSLALESIRLERKNIHSKTSYYSLEESLLFIPSASSIKKISWRIYHLDCSLGTHSVRIILE